MYLGIVRKTGWIALFALLCLLCGAESPGCGAAPAQRRLSFSCAERTADQIDCERTYNSDLNLLTRLCPQMLPAQSPVPGLRSGQRAERPLQKFCPAAGFNGGTVCAVSHIYSPQTICAGASAVDLYVYRLRRLII